jgi:hypothetical protein
MTGHKNCLQSDYLLGPGPRLIKKRIYLAAVSQSLRNTGLEKRAQRDRKFKAAEMTHFVRRDIKIYIVLGGVVGVATR